MSWTGCSQPRKTGQDPGTCIADDALERHRAIYSQEILRVNHLAIPRGCEPCDDRVGNSKKSIRTKQPPEPGNTTSSKPPRQMSCPVVIRAVQNKPLSTFHSCKGMSTTTSFTPLNPPCNRAGPPDDLIRTTPNPTMDSL
jgi:hypothetical protein